MFDLGIKNLILNNSLGVENYDSSRAIETAAATVANIKVNGIGDVAVANISNVYGNRATPGAVFSNVITLGGAGPAFAGLTDVTFQVDVESSRLSYEYSRYAMTYGKLISFSATVPAAATANDVAVALVANIDARITKYGDLPFTAAVTGAGIITLTGVAGEEHVSVKFAYDGLKATDKNAGTSLYGAITASEALTRGVAPVGSGAWVEENIAMHTLEAGRLNSVRPQDLVARGGNYAAVYFDVAFTDGTAAAPGVVGGGVQSGSYTIGLHVNEAEIGAGGAVDVMLEALIIADNTNWTLSDGEVTDAISDTLKFTEWSTDTHA